MKKKQQIAPLPNRRLRSSAATAPAAAAAPNKVSSTVPAKRSDLAEKKSPARVTRGKSAGSTSLDVKKTVDFKRKGGRSEAVLVSEVTPTRSLRNRVVVVEKSVDLDRKGKKSVVEKETPSRSLRNRDVVVDVLSPKPGGSGGGVAAKEVSVGRRSRATQAEMLVRDDGEEVVKKRKSEPAVIPRMALKKGKMSVVEAPARRLTRSVHVDAAEDGVVKRKKSGGVERAEAEKRKLLVDQGSPRRFTRRSGGTEDIDAASEKLVKKTKPESVVLTTVSPSKAKKGKLSARKESPRRVKRGSDIAEPASDISSHDEKVVKKSKPGKPVTNRSSRNKAVVAPAESRKPGKKQVANRSPRSKAASPPAASRKPGKKQVTNKSPRNKAAAAPAESSKPGKRATSKSASKGKGTRKFEGIHVGKNSKGLKPRKGSTLKKENLGKQDKKQPRASSVSNSASTSKAPKEESQMVVPSSRRSSRNALDHDASVLGAIKSGDDDVMVDGNKLSLPSKRGTKRRGSEAPLLPEEQKDSRRQKLGGCWTMESESYLSGEAQVLDSGSNEAGFPLKSDACAAAAEDFTADLSIEVETQITGIVGNDDLTERIVSKTQEHILPDNNASSPMSGLEVPTTVREDYACEIVEGSTVACEDGPNDEIEVERNMEAASDVHLDIKGNIYCSNDEQKVDSQTMPPVMSVETSESPLITDSCMSSGQMISGEFHEETHSRSELLFSSHIKENRLSELTGANLGSENEGLIAPADAGDAPLEAATQINSFFATQTSCHQERSIGSSVEDAYTNVAGLSGIQVDCRNEEPTCGEALAAMLDAHSPLKGDTAEKCIGHAVEITFKPTYLSSGEGINAEKGRNNEVTAESNVSYSIPHNTFSDIGCDDQVQVANREPHSPQVLDESNLMKDPVFEAAEQLSAEDVLDDNDNSMSHVDLPHFDCSEHREENSVPVAEREVPSLKFFDETNQTEDPVFELAEQLNAEDDLADENANCLPHAVGSKRREQADVLDTTVTDTTFHVSGSLNGFEDMEVTDLEGSDSLYIGSVPNALVGATSVGNESATPAINVEDEFYNYTETVFGRQDEDSQTYHSAIDDDSVTDAIPCEDDSKSNTILGTFTSGPADNAQVSAQETADFSKSSPIAKAVDGATTVGYLTEDKTSSPLSLGVDRELHTYIESQVPIMHFMDAEPLESNIPTGRQFSVALEYELDVNEVVTDLGASLPWEHSEDVEVTTLESPSCFSVSSGREGTSGATSVERLNVDYKGIQLSLNANSEVDKCTETSDSSRQVVDIEPSNPHISDCGKLDEVFHDDGSNKSNEESTTVGGKFELEDQVFCTQVVHVEPDETAINDHGNTDDVILSEGKSTETEIFSRRSVDMEPYESPSNDHGYLNDANQYEDGDKSSEGTNTIGASFSTRVPEYGDPSLHDVLMHENDEKCNERATTVGASLPCISAEHGDGTFTNVLQHVDGRDDKHNEVTNAVGALFSCGPVGHDVNNFTDDDKCNEEMPSVDAPFSCERTELGVDEIANRVSVEGHIKFDSYPQAFSKQVADAAPGDSIYQGEGNFTNVAWCEDGDKCDEVTNAAGTSVSSGPAEVVGVSSVEVPGLSICSDSNTLPGST